MNNYDIYNDFNPQFVRLQGDSFLEDVRKLNNFQVHHLKLRITINKCIKSLVKDGRCRASIFNHIDLENPFDTLFNHGIINFTMKNINLLPFNYTREK